MVIDKLKPASNPAVLPFLLLLFALSTVFLFANDRSHFYRSGTHAYLSSHGMTLAANLSSDHHFLLFNRQILGANGAHGYEPYNRFPIGTYSLIKLVILPFEDDLKKQIYAARLLMLLFFAAAAVLAYLSLCQLTSSQWIALTATLLSFSSYYCLYYNDMVFNDVPSFFGFLLTFYGMVTFVQKGRFLQLLLKTCVALLLGWQVFALLLPFVVFGLVSELIHERSGRMGGSLLSSRFLILGVVALLFGTFILAFNFANEYFALNGKTALTQLPTFQSMLQRFGASPEFKVHHAESLKWLPVLKELFSRVSGTSFPFSVPFSTGWSVAVLGAGVFSVCLIGLLVVHHKILWATLVLSGPSWMLPMRHFVVFHDFQSLFYIGIPLVFFSLVLLYIHKLSINHLIIRLAVAALLVFILSSFHISFRGGNLSEFHEAIVALLPEHLIERIVKNQVPKFHEATITDFEAMRKIVGQDKIVFVSVKRGDEKWGMRFAGAYHAVDYYLAGNIIEYRDEYQDEKQRRDLSDFIIMSEREAGPALLTPENRLMFLYDRAAYDNKEMRDPLSS